MSRSLFNLGTGDVFEDHRDVVQVQLLALVGFSLLLRGVQRRHLPVHRRSALRRDRTRLRVAEHLLPIVVVGVGLVFSCLQVGVARWRTAEGLLDRLELESFVAVLERGQPEVRHVGPHFLGSPVRLREVRFQL